MNLSPDFRPVVVSSSDGTVISGRPGWVILYMCPSVPPLDEIAVRMLHHPIRKVRRELGFGHHSNSLSNG